MYRRCGIRCPELELGEDIRAGASSSSPERRAETPNGRDYADALDDFLKALGRGAQGDEAVLIRKGLISSGLLRFVRNDRGSGNS